MKPEGTFSSFLSGVKLVLISILGIGGILKTCVRSSDEFVDMARYTDDIELSYDAARGIDRGNDLRTGGKWNAIVELDVTRLSTSAIQERLTLFEVSHLDRLDDASFVKKAWKDSEGFSSNMRMLTLQSQLMPAPVRNALSFGDGADLYPVMMGKSISKAEADAIFELFHVRVTHTTKTTPNHQFLTTNPYVQSPLEHASAEKLIPELPENGFYIRNTQSTQSVYDYSPPRPSKETDLNKVFYTDELPEESGKTLFLKDIRKIHKISKIIKLLNDDKSKMKMVIICPSTVDSIVQLYQFSNQEASDFLKACNAWKKLSHFVFYPSLNNIHLQARKMNPDQNTIILLPPAFQEQDHLLPFYILKLKSKNTPEKNDLLDVSTFIQAVNLLSKKNFSSVTFFLQELPDAITSLHLKQGIQNTLIIDLNIGRNYLRLCDPYIAQ